ncbi:MAG TPA: GIY-YIG nuclease family protein [Chthoniobacterales bacterium]
MAWVYILRGATGRYYIGATEDLERRVAEHQRGSNHTTKRLGYPLELIAKCEFRSMTEARQMEQDLKAKKNPQLAVAKLKALAGE